MKIWIKLCSSKRAGRYNYYKLNNRSLGFDNFLCACTSTQFHKNIHDVGYNGRARTPVVYNRVRNHYRGQDLIYCNFQYACRLERHFLKMRLSSNTTHKSTATLFRSWFSPFFARMFWLDGQIWFDFYFNLPRIYIFLTN